MYWNFVLDSKGQPTPAVHDTECFGIISLDEKRSEQGIAYKYSKSSAYYVMGHVSKFLYDVDGVGCYGINATSDYADLVFMSYYRNDGAIVVVVCNTNETNNANVDIVIDNKYKISYDFVPQSIVTFVA